MELPIVVGVDGSEPGARAVDWAADEAARREVPLRLVHASLWQRYEGVALAADLGGQAEGLEAAHVVEDAVRRARRRRPDVKVSSEVLVEEPEYVLVRESRHACLLVTGTRGNGALTEALLGSVSLTVAGHAHCPMVVVRGTPGGGTGPGRVVVGVGDGPAGAAALDFAFEEARRRAVPLEAVRAWRCPARESLAGDPARQHERRAADELEAALRDAPPDVDVRRRTVEGHPRDVLVDASHEAGLLVVGARRGKRHFGLQLGRVTHGVLHHSTCPVTVVPERQ
ncbi:universal stress protein [Streptomyces sp. NPDC090106]|uniref:universal stress protein n=1 Tax=Streptomyces sp. NPDC090106 TaxID=3365946 RepID=UPI003811F54E